MNWRDMDKGSTVSAIGHLGVILWAVMGDWLFAPKDMPPMEVAEVSLMSEGEFQAMMASAPKPKEPSEAPAEPAVEAPEPVETDLPEPEPTPEPEPAPEAPAEPVPVEEVLPETVPVSPEVQPIEAPPPVAEVAEEEQPIPVPESSIKPKPRPAQRITEVPVESEQDTPELAEEATPEVSDQAEPEAEVVEVTEPAAAPEESAAMVAPDAVENDAPELAPTASRRPQSRPERQVQAEDAAEPEAQATDEAADRADAEAEAIAAALAEAAAESAAESASADQGLPEGPPMTRGEIEGLHLAINKCWNVGALSTAAMNTTISVRAEMGENGKPTNIELTGFEGGDESAAGKVFEAARRAIIRCAGQTGYDLPPEKYSEWNALNMSFDPNGMRLR